MLNRLRYWDRYIQLKSHPAPHTSSHDKKRCPFLKCNKNSCSPMSFDHIQLPWCLRQQRCNWYFHLDDTWRMRVSFRIVNVLSCMLAFCIDYTVHGFQDKSPCSGCYRRCNHDRLHFHLNQKIFINGLQVECKSFAHHMRKRCNIHRWHHIRHTDISRQLCSFD